MNINQSEFDKKNRL